MDNDESIYQEIMLADRRTDAEIDKITKESLRVFYEKMGEWKETTQTRQRKTQSAIKTLNAIAKLAKAGGGDAEIDHGKADDILVQVLRDNGLAEVADAYENCAEEAGFWYA